MVAVRDVQELVEQLLPQIHFPFSATGEEIVLELFRISEQIKT